MAILLYGIDDWEYDYDVAVLMTCHFGPLALGVIVQYVKTHSYDTIRFVCSNDSVRVDMSASTETIPRDDIAIMVIFTILDHGALGHIFHDPRG